MDDDQPTTRRLRRRDVLRVGLAAVAGGIATGGAAWAAPGGRTLPHGAEALNAADMADVPHRLGDTRVICGVMIEETVPRWMKESREGGMTGGWLTAEYSMLPYSTTTRKPRDISKGRLDGRSTEIQRLIGRSLRAVVDLEKLGPRTMWVDCDVLQADGGTRTAAITGASLAVAIACRKLIDEKKIAVSPIRASASAIPAAIGRCACRSWTTHRPATGFTCSADCPAIGRPQIWQWGWPIRAQSSRR